MAKSGICIAAIWLLLSGCASLTTSDCGQVASYAVPNEEEGLYPAMITHIDGIPVRAKAFYPLVEGSHTITLAELVSAPSLSVPLMYRVAKTISVEVDTGRRYHLAARFIPEFASQDSSEYWQPVVWQQQDYACQQQEFKEEND